MLDDGVGIIFMFNIAVHRDMALCGVRVMPLANSNCLEFNLQVGGEFAVGRQTA